MIRECANCGAPLEVAGSLWTKCNYCRVVQRVGAMRPTQAESPQPAPAWTPRNGGPELPYRPVSRLYRYSRALLTGLIVVTVASPVLTLLRFAPSTTYAPTEDTDEAKKPVESPPAPEPTLPPAPPPRIRERVSEDDASEGPQGKLVGIASGGTCEFVVDDRSRGVSSAFTMNVRAGEHVISCKTGIEP